MELPQTPIVKKTSSLGVPIAIVIAALLIAGAIIFAGMQKNNLRPMANDIDSQGTEQTPEANIAPVTEKDHIKGNPNAPIMIVEYSDFECPFCKNFHETMNKIMNDYGADGKVAWVYRQFPLEQLHPNAPRIAAASECVAELGGNDAFWKFSDLIFGERATNAQTDMLKLPEYAVQSGVHKDAYTQCVNTNKYSEKIKSDIQAAADAGARGTPYSFLIVGGKQVLINGAQPYATVKQMIESMLKQIDA